MKGLTKTRLKKLVSERWDITEVKNGVFCSYFEKNMYKMSDGEENKVSFNVYFELFKKGKALRLIGHPCDVSIPAKRRGEAVLLCNYWNNRYLFGRAMFSQHGKMVMCDGGLSIQHEMTDDEIVDFMVRTISAFIEFCNIAADTFGW